MVNIKYVYINLFYLNIALCDMFESDIDSHYKGKFPAVGDLPHIVHITTINKDIHCTGAIINESWVITAAHCFYIGEKRINTEEVEIESGIVEYMFPNDTRQKRQVETIVLHPKFWLDNLSRYDVALIKLKEPFMFNEYVSFIEIEENGWPNQNGHFPRRCTSAGFGIIAMDEEDTPKSTRLKKMYVDAMHGEDSCDCTQRFQWKRLVCLPSTTDPILCNGDSGGVLVCDNKAVAIAHMVMDSKSCNKIKLPTKFKLCGRINTLNTYIFICPLNDWIQSYVDNVPHTPTSCIGCNINSCVYFIIICVFIAKIVVK